MKIKSILYILVISLFAVFSSLTLAANEFTPSQVKQIQNIIHDYLVKNPTVLVEASHALQQQQAVEQEQHALSAMREYKDQIFNSKGKPVAGNANGDIVLVEFFDYQCPHCQEMGPIIDNLIKANSNLKVIFAEWPIFGGDSEFAAGAALAAMNQNKYYPFHLALTAHGYPLSSKQVLSIAKSVGIDVDKLQADMKNSAITDQLKDNFKIAERLKMVGTPGFLVANLKANKFKYLDGQTDQDTLQGLIDAVK